MAKYQIQVQDGSVYEIETDDKPVSEEKTVAKEEKEPNAFNVIFDIPSAANRAAIRSNPKLIGVAPISGLLASTGLFGEDAKRAVVQGAVEGQNQMTFQQEEFNKAVDKGDRNVGLYGAALKGTVMDMWADPAGSLIDVLTSGIGKGVQALKVSRASKTANKLRRKASENILKASAPAQGKMANRTAIQNYSTKLSLAADTILENSDNLKYYDESGNLFSQGVPKSLDEFSSAIAQTKTKVFDEYSQLAQQASEQGAFVDLTDTVLELKKLSSNPSIRTNFPEIARYADDYASRLANERYFTLDSADDTIKALNNKLKTYYSKGTYDPGRLTEVDALVKNSISKKLDDVITTTVGEGYQPLKLRYGALRSIEEDVNKALFKKLKKPKASLPDLINAYAASDIIFGLAGGNPALVAKGGLIAGAKKYIDIQKNPDIAVKNTFNILQKIKNGDFTKETINFGRVIGKTSPQIRRQSNQEEQQ